MKESLLLTQDFNSSSQESTERFFGSYTPFIAPRLTGSVSFLVFKKLNNLTSVMEEDILIVKDSNSYTLGIPGERIPSAHLLSAKRTSYLLKKNRMQDGAQAGDQAES